MTLEVREPEEQELDPVVLDLLESVLAGLLARGGPVLRLDLLRHAKSSLNARSPGRQLPEATLPQQQPESTTILSRAPRLLNSLHGQPVSRESGGVQPLRTPDWSPCNRARR